MAGFLGRFDDFLASLGGRFWVWFGIVSFLLVYGLINHAHVMGWPSPDVFLRTIDSDVYIRLTKVRELIQDGNLYNHDVVATNAPYGGMTTPWTRPLDFILVTLYQFTPSNFSIEKRLLLTANWYPLLIIALIIYFLSKAAETGFKSLQKFGLVVLCLVTDLIFNSQSYFMAGNADHHSVQGLLWCIAIWLMLEKPSPLRAVYLGLALGLWFWISPEALPFIFTAYAVLGIKAVLKPTETYFPTLTSIIVTLTTLLALFVEYPAEKVFATRAYDTISMVYVILFSFCAIGFMALHSVISRHDAVKFRLVASGITAVIISALYVVLFPKFLDGPMADVEPYIITHFLPRISEATPLLKLEGPGILAVLYLSIPAIFLSLRFIKRTPMLIVFLVVPFVMNFFQSRWYYYLEISSIVAISKFLPVYARALARKHRTISFLLHPYALIIILCVAVYGISSSFPPSKYIAYQYINKCQYNVFQVIQSGALVDALGNAPLTMESNALGNGGISFFTPYNYIAGYYHREGKGLQVKDAIFDAKDLNAVRHLLRERNVKALLICPIGYPSWVNDYFTDKPPQLNWVKVNTVLNFPQGDIQKTKPLILMVNP